MRSTFLLIALVLIVFAVVAVVEHSPDIVPTTLQPPVETLNPVGE